MPKVRFLNELVTVEVPHDTVLRDVAADNGVEILRGLWPHLHCKGLGICGRCKIWVTSKPDTVSSPTLRERFRFIRGEMRLACMVRVRGDVDVRTRPIGPAFVELKAGEEPAEEASYKEAAAEKLVEAKAEEKKKAEALAAKKKKAAEAKAKKEAEEAAAKEAEAKVEAKPEEKEAEAKPEAKAEDAKPEAKAVARPEEKEAEAKPEKAEESAPKPQPGVSEGDEERRARRTEEAKKAIAAIKTQSKPPTMELKPVSKEDV